jgi:sugar-specific transcriptional regulator TrmB
MKNKLKSLQDLGLSKNEAEIYLSLLKFGSLTAEGIAKSSSVHRRNVYDSLHTLMRKGLVGYLTKDQKKYFRASNPRQLLEMIEDEKEQLKKKEISITSALSGLLKIKQVAEDENLVTIYQGVKGIKSLLNDILATGKENLVFLAYSPPDEIKNFLSNFHKKRIRLGIKEKLIFTKGDEGRAARLSRMSHTQVRFIAKRRVGKTAINIYDNKVSIIMWVGPVGILIENREVADSFRNYFKAIWKEL